jgi:hypothetical protein
MASTTRSSTNRLKKMHATMIVDESPVGSSASHTSMVLEDSVLLVEMCVFLLGRF